MARATSAMLALSSVVLGAMTRMPTLRALFVPQVLLNEVGWIPAAAGSMAALTSLVRKPRSVYTALLGLCGAALSSGSLFAYRRARAEMDGAMRAALGQDYEARIAPEGHPRWTPSDLSLWRLLVGPKPVAAVKVERDVVYHVTPQRALKLDVYTPAKGSGPFPVIIAIHGGSWYLGDKGQLPARHHRLLAAQGFAVFDIQYRLSPEAVWPAQLDDVRAAIRWVKRHAAEYGGDATRLALLGRSAGAHLALCAGYRADDDHADTCVSAVVAYYPPTDLSIWDAVAGSPLDMLLCGTKLQAPARYAEASPINYCRDGLPPTLLLQGDMDDLVEPEHVSRLERGLRQTDTTFVTLHVPWGRHGFDMPIFGLGAQLTQGYVERFLAWALAGAPTQV